MKSVILFSGGKDSTMAVYEALKNNDEIYALLAMVSKNDESYMFHVPNIHMVDYCSAAMEIPSIDVLTQGVKEEELDDLENTLIRLLFRSQPKTHFLGALTLATTPGETWGRRAL